MGLGKKVMELIFGSKQEKDKKRFMPYVNRINGWEEEISKLSNDGLQRKTVEFQERLKKGEKLDDLLPEAFAVVREASKRTIGLRHFDVQMLGGMALHQGNIAEMKTGEGKTLVATLPMYVNALDGRGCHLITVNDYLARRDALWMGPIYRFLGLTVGVINHDISYRLEWDDLSKFTLKLVNCNRREAYHCDITYGTNNEFGFDYLRDNMVFAMRQKVQRKHNYCIVDEVDSILIDEARTPLIISGPSEEATDLYYRIDKFIPRLTEAQVNDKKEPIEGTGDYVVDEKDKTSLLTEMGIDKVEKMLGVKELYSPKNSKLVHHVLQGIRAHKLYHIDVDYVVENGEVVIVDEFTGRKMPGRRWSDGLHQAIEAKERMPIKQENQTLATITFQNYFRMYNKLSGMTGTAETEASELYTIYGLDVIVIPPNQLVVRKDFSDKIFINEKAKFDAIVRDVQEKHKKGQPVLLGTISVEKSEKLGILLKRKGIIHNVLNAKFHEKEAEIIMNAGMRGSVTIATNMAGRGTDIKLGPGVVEAGGLCVIGSERHEARRIDNQLRGRAGRQGDPGESQFYVSLEDDLMRLFGMDKRMGMMTAMGFTEEEEIQSKWISNAIEKAQKRVENRNFDIRKHLLDYDNVMSEQRVYIYGLRDKILEIQDNPNVIGDLIHEIVEDYIYEQTNGSKRPDAWDKFEIQKWLRNSFGIEKQIDFGNLEYKQAMEEIVNSIRDMVWDRFVGVPEEVRYEAFRYVLLTVLDTKWKDHLRNIDSLQEGIGLRGYAQKNPLVEYKIEASHMFVALKSNFKAEAISLMARIRIESTAAKEEVYEEDKVQPTQTVHQEVGQFNRPKKSGNAATQSSNNQARRMEKPGRNDDCWCGSGKKYKKCHMEEDESKERHSTISK